MELSLKNIFIIVLYIECCLGITVNLIILTVNIKKWKTLKSLSTCDMILSCLVLSRGLSLFGFFVSHGLYQLYPMLILNLIVSVALLTLGRILYFTDLWFATVLCVFYCVKITSYNWKFFYIMKTKISTLVPWLILASILISLSSSVSFSLYFIYKFNPQNISNSSEEWINAYRDDITQTFYSQFLIVLIGSCPPFLVFLAADCLLLHSLWMHTRRMRSSGSGFRSPNLESHFSAVKSMSFFLVLQIIYFVFMNVLFSGLLQDAKVLRLVNAIVNCCPPFLHSLYTICSSNEMKKTFISMIPGNTRCEYFSNGDFLF